MDMLRLADSGVSGVYHPGDGIRRRHTMVTVHIFGLSIIIRVGDFDSMYINVCLGVLVARIKQVYDVEATSLSRVVVLL
jgi:hypothetical protein